MKYLIIKNNPAELVISELVDTISLSTIFYYLFLIRYFYKQGGNKKL